MVEAVAGERTIRENAERGTMPAPRIFRDVTATVGNTPLIELSRLTKGLPARVVVKHEGYNPFNSVKDRIGAAMVDDAIERGTLKPGW